MECGRVGGAEGGGGEAVGVGEEAEAEASEVAAGGVVSVGGERGAGGGPKEGVGTAWAATALEVGVTVATVVEMPEATSAAVPRAAWERQTVAPRQ